MKKIVYEIFDKEGEIVSFTDGSGKYADIIFKNLNDGYLTVGGEAHRITEGRVTLNLTSLPEGEIAPVLTSNGAFISLPALFKDGSVLCPAETDDAYIREISIRERRTAKRLGELEAKIKALEKSVYGTKIF